MNHQRWRRNETQNWKGRRRKKICHSCWCARSTRATELPHLGLKQLVDTQNERTLNEQVPRNTQSTSNERRQPVYQSSRAYRNLCENTYFVGDCVTSTEDDSCTEASGTGHRRDVWLVTCGGRSTHVPNGLCHTGSPRDSFGGEEERKVVLGWIRRVWVVYGC